PNLACLPVRDGMALFVLLTSCASASQPNGEDLDEDSGPQKAIGFLLASKGLVCGIVWFENNSFPEFVMHLLTNGFKKQKADSSDEIDLSPQVNTALRRELLHYITVGVMEAVSRADNVPAGVASQLIQIPRGLHDKHP